MLSGNGQNTDNRIQLVLDAAPMSVTLYDSSLSLIDCNMEAVRLFELPSKKQFLTVVNEQYNNFFPNYQPCGTLTKAKSQWIFEKAIQDGRIQIEHMHLTASGKELPTEVTAVRIDHDDTFIVAVYLRDLRKEKKVEVSEREATQWGNALYESSPMCVEIWEIHDDQIVLVDCNDRATKLFEVSSKKDYIENHFDYTPKYQPCGTPSNERAKEILEIIQRDGYGTFEYMHMTANGEELPVEFTFVRLFRSGKPMMVGYAYDLRNLKKAQQLEIAEESNKAKSRFLARMSHEIRTPITAVMGISEIQLRNNTIPPQTEDAFAKIYDSSKTLLHIVNDILDFSKIESGKMSLVNGEYDVASLVSDVSQLHLLYVDEKDIKFQVYVDKNLPIKLIGDTLRIRQIISNLLTNAFKYTESGTVLLSLQFEKIENGQIMLFIAVHDTGMGMTAEQIEEIENTDSEYLRLHEAEKPFVSGTGLGLPIVYSLAKMMNAQIDVKSTPQKGTRWLIRIPQEISGSAILGEELANRLQNFETGIWRVSKGLEFVPEPMPYGKVLVVDDVASNLYVMEAMLDFFGVIVELCESGEEAIEKVKQGKVYDIIFLDHMMPNMDGIETAKILRDMDYTHPIVACTANALKGQAEMFKENGFSGFMSKPIEINRLNSHLVRYIKEKQNNNGK